MREVLRWLGAIAVWLIFLVLVIFGSQLQGLYFLALAAIGFVILMFKRTGRLKWMLIGLIAGLYLAHARNENSWIYVCLALFLLFLHDEKIRERLIDDAVHEAREELRSDQIKVTDSERVISVTLRQLSKKLWEPQAPKSSF